MNANVGAKEKFSIDDDLDISKVIPGNGVIHVTGEVAMMRLPHEINVQVKRLNSEVVGTCNRCLKVFKIKLAVSHAEREFIIDLPAEEIEPGEDIFYVDKRTREIDLTDMVSHELLLHFPLIPVCSESCKGLCDQCGVNLNETTCSCKHITRVANSPFRFPH